MFRNPWKRTHCKIPQKPKPELPSDLSVLYCSMVGRGFEPKPKPYVRAVNAVTVPCWFPLKSKASMQSQLACLFQRDVQVARCCHQGKHLTSGWEVSYLCLYTEPLTGSGGDGLLAARCHTLTEPRFRPWHI